MRRAGPPAPRAATAAAHARHRPSRSTLSALVARGFWGQRRSPAVWCPGTEQRAAHTRPRPSRSTLYALVARGFVGQRRSPAVWCPGTEQRTGPPAPLHAGAVALPRSSQVQRRLLGQRRSPQSLQLSPPAARAPPTAALAAVVVMRVAVVVMVARPISLFLVVQKAHAVARSAGPLLCDKDVNMDMNMNLMMVARPISLFLVVQQAHAVAPVLCDKVLARALRGLWGPRTGANDPSPADVREAHVGKV